MAQLTLLIIFSVFINFAFGDDIITAKPVPTESYRHSLSLDEMENYYLFWTFDEDFITFEVHVKTQGWVGFGMSSTGGMKGADIVVGWVKNGQAQLHDLHGVGQERPLVDDTQNYELVKGEQTTFFTVLKFRRELDTCDEQDYNVEEGTIRLIFAWGKDDPDLITDLQYHGSEQRGIRSLMLLDFGKAEHSDPENYEQMQYFDLTVNNASLKENRTTYFCRVAALPNLSTKKHIVKVSPLIEKKNVAVVHHILVYECHGNLQEDLEGRICWEGRMPDNATFCDGMMFAWAVGQDDFYFPKDVGYPIGAENQARYIQLEMHYDNPNHIPGIVDNSGLRFYYTEPGKQEAGTMMVGHTVWWPPIAIPPNTEKFQIDSYCNSECTGIGIPESGIRVFAALLHTHLVGSSVWMKHLRNGEELPEIVREDHYDFDYQRDELLTSCIFSTKGKRNKMTYGGPGTDNEMCLAFMLYYPRVKLQSCLSSVQAYYPIHQWVMQKAMTGEIKIDPKNEDKNVYDYLDEFEWTDEDREVFQKKVQQSPGYTQNCALKESQKGLFGGTESKYYKKIEIEKPFYKERKCKTSPVSSATPLTTMFWFILSSAVTCFILNI